MAELGSGGRDSEAGDDEKGGAVRLRDNGSSETRVSSLSSGGRDDEKGCAVRLRYGVLCGTRVWSLGLGGRDDEKGGGTVRGRECAADADGRDNVSSETRVSSLRGNLIGSACVAELGSGGRDSKAGGAARARDNLIILFVVVDLGSGGGNRELICLVWFRDELCLPRETVMFVSFSEAESIMADSPSICCPLWLMLPEHAAADVFRVSGCCE